MECTSLSQANTTILTGFHSASLRHPFSSVAFSPPAAHYLARLRSPLRLRSACIRTAHSLRPFRLRLLGFTCIVQPPPYPDGKYTPAASYGAGIGLLRRPLLTSPLWGLAATFVRASLRWLTAARLLRYSADKCAARLCFLLAQGCFTCWLNTMSMLLRTQY